jgi:2-keto-4-pentenoate hydratase/2-oxohepta-3-ene-1,7-dioic acid hydratase in catechol pathway
MKLATFEYQDQVRIGAVRGDEVVLLESVAPDMLTLIDGGAQKLAQARQVADSARAIISLPQVKLLAPIPRPRKNIFAVGRNYADHAKESADARGEKVGPPVIFTKAPTTVNAPFGDIIIDPEVSTQIDWEAELAVIIGRRARKVKQSDALNYVFGYTVLNDVTARDLQNRTSQFFVGKSLDGYAPMGPWLVTADEISDPQNLDVMCRVNGVVKQTGNTREMMYTVAYIIEYLSLLMTLEPGDIITTGTPAGVGFARKPPEFLKPGDVLESHVEKIGGMRNKII